jgi:DNA ligase-1
LFTRRLEDVTKQFPDIAEYVKKNVKGKSFIIDSEAVGYNRKTGKYMPFQNISQRIKRKYDIDRMSHDFPVELNVFDIIYHEGKSLINEDFEKRRTLLERIVKQEPKKIVLAKNKIASDKKDVEKFFKEAVNAGNEGLMFKSLKAPYKPGARVGYMIKFKHIMETLDLVIIGAEWGEGKRAKWLSSYHIACLDENDNFVEIGKASTGLKEKEEEGLSFMEMTKLLKPLIISEKGKEVKVKPKIVIEVGYEEIQKSPTYTSGFALRFPRVIQIREDKGPDEASTLDYIKKLYAGQKKS